MRFYVALPLAVCACSSAYNRPPTVEYLTEAVFAPSCGKVGCHGTFNQQYNVVLDTVAMARNTFVNNGYLQFSFDSEQDDALDPDNSSLLIWTTQTVPYNTPGYERMPLDTPLTAADTDLMRQWVAAYAPGASCDPANFGGLACKGLELHACTTDWSFGDLVQTCTNVCQQGKCQ